MLVIYCVTAVAIAGQNTQNKIVTGTVESVTRYEITVKVKAEKLKLALSEDTDISIDRKGAGRDKLAKGQSGTVLYDVLTMDVISMKLSTPEALADREAEKKQEEMDAVGNEARNLAARKAAEDAARLAKLDREAAVKAFYAKIMDQSVLGMEITIDEKCDIMYDSTSAVALQNAAFISDGEYSFKLKALSRKARVRVIAKGTVLRVIEARKSQEGLSERSNGRRPVIVKCRVIKPESDKDEGREVWVFAESLVATPAGPKNIPSPEPTDNDKASKDKRKSELK